MSERKSVFSPYEDRIVAKIKKIKADGVNAVLESDNHQNDPFDTSEYEEEEYVCLLEYLQYTLIDVILHDLHEIGQDEIFQKFATDEEMEWDDIDYDLHRKYDATAIGAAYFFWYLYFEYPVEPVADSNKTASTQKLSILLTALSSDSQFQFGTGFSKN